MNCVFINPIKGDDWGGMENWMLRLATGFHARGDACLLVGRAGSRWPAAAAERGLPYAPFEFGSDATPWRLRPLRALMRRMRPDVVCAKGFRQARFARLTWPAAAIVVKLPNPNDLPGALVDRLTFRHAVDRVVTDSRAVRRLFLRHPWVAPGKVVAVHNGLVEPGPYPDPARRLAARRALGAADGELIVMSVGRFAPEKRLEDAIAAFAAARVPPPARLILVGEGPGRPDLERAVAAAGIRAEFPGWRPDARDLLWGADILLHPSATEGMANTVLEAMAAGVAVLATPVGGVPESLRRDLDGLYFSPGDVAALTALLRRAAGDPALRQRLGDSAAAHVRAGFTIDAMVDGVRRVALEAATARAALRARPVRLAGGWHWVARPGSDAQPAWLDLPQSDTVETVKSTDRSRVVRSPESGRVLYAKAWQTGDAAGLVRYGLRAPRALANFRAAQRIALLGAETVPHLAAGWRRRGGLSADSVLVSSAPPGAIPLPDAVAARAAGRPLRRLCRDAGAWLAALHGSDIVPHDLKATNLLVREADGRAEFILLDLDNCRIGLFAVVSGIVRNLYQLLRSFRSRLTARDLAAFGAAYRRKRRLSRAAAAYLFRHVRERAEQRLRT